MNAIPLVDSERTTQNRIVNLLHKHCGYQYIGYLQDADNSPLRTEEFQKFLRAQYPDIQSSELEKVTAQVETQIRNVHDANTLYEANEKIYQLLRYGVNIHREDGKSATFQIIDWKTTANNIFSLAEEVTVRRNVKEYRTRRPDVVVYVNGLALAVIELKKSTVSVKDGVRQQIRNNKNDNEICHFFATAQFLLAGNDSEGVYYGTILTPEKFYLRWKEPTGQGYPNNNAEPDPYPEKYTRQDFPNELDRSLLQLLDPDRLLTLIHDCVIFDGGIKKVCRPN